MRYWHSRHNPKLAISSEEIQRISQTISQTYHPLHFSQAEPLDFPQLIILPIDPYHIHAYWRITGAMPSQCEDDSSLILRLFWRFDRLEAHNHPHPWLDVSNSQFRDQTGCGVCLARMSAAGSCRQVPMDGFTAFLDRDTPHPKSSEKAQTENCWLDVGVVSKQANAKIKLPVAGAVYTAAIGQCDRNGGFIAHVHSRPVSLPPCERAPLASVQTPLVFDEADIDAKIRQTLAARHAESDRCSPLSLIDSPAERSELDLLESYSSAGASGLQTSANTHSGA